MKESNLRTALSRMVCRDYWQVSWNHRNEALEYLYAIKLHAQTRENNQRAKSGANTESGIHKGPIRQCRKLKNVMDQ